MKIFSKDLVKSLDFEKKINCACSFNNAKCEFIQGKILTFEGTNISFIEPHRIDILIKNKNIMLLYFDKNNLFLYNRSIQISLEQLFRLLEELREC